MGCTTSSRACRPAAYNPQHLLYHYHPSTPQSQSALLINSHRCGGANACPRSITSRTAPPRSRPAALIMSPQDATHSSQGLSADLVLQARTPPISPDLARPRRRTSAAATGLAPRPHAALTRPLLSPTPRCAQALTSNAKACFLILVRHQLEQPASAGLSLREWFSVCRQEWAATNEANLVGYIKEYTDHNMLRARPGPGGTECHYCTLPKEVMARLAHAVAPEDEAAGA